MTSCTFVPVPSSHPIAEHGPEASAGYFQDDLHFQDRHQVALDIKIESEAIAYTRYSADVGHLLAQHSVTAAISDRSGALSFSGPVG